MMRYRWAKKYLFLGLAVALLGGGFYFGWEHYVTSTTCLKIPVKFSQSNIPILDVVIEGKICPLELDLGSKFSLSLDNDLLEKIDKQERGTVKWRDLRGDPHEASSYLIPKVDVYGFSWKNVAARETNAQFKAATFLWRDEQKIKEHEEVGKIGWPLLEKTNLCLDLSHKAVFSCNSLKTLQSKGICPKDLVKIPFHIKRGVMLVQVETDVGKLHLAIDTGATATLVRPSFMRDLAARKDRHGLSFCTTSRFAFGGRNFGKLDLYLYDLIPQFQEMDGILGMNFLEKHIIYIDYPNKTLYIGDCNPDSSNLSE